MTANESSNSWTNNKLITPAVNSALLELLQYYHRQGTVALVMSIFSKGALSADEEIVAVLETLEAFDDDGCTTSTAPKIAHPHRSCWDREMLFREAFMLDKSNQSKSTTDLLYHDHDTNLPPPPVVGLPPPDLCSYLAVVLGNKMKCEWHDGFWDDGDESFTIALTTPKRINLNTYGEEDPSASKEKGMMTKKWYPYHHFNSYRCISELGANDTIWRVYVCIADTATHKKGTVVEMDHWDDFFEGMGNMSQSPPPLSPPGDRQKNSAFWGDVHLETSTCFGFWRVTMAMDDIDGEPFSEEEALVLEGKKGIEPYPSHWPYNREEGDQLVKYPFRGCHDRKPMIFRDIVRFLKSLVKNPNRREASNEADGSDFFPWFKRSD